MLVRAVVLCVMLWSATAEGTTYYVSNSTANGWAVGSSSNDCLSISTPCLTLSDGWVKLIGAGPGHTLIINSGTYVQGGFSLQAATISGTSFANATTIRCVSFRTCTFRPTLGSAAAFQFISAQVHHIILKDIVFDMVNANVNCLKMGSTGNPAVDGSPRFIRMDGIECKNAHSSSPGGSTGIAMHNWTSADDSLAGKGHEILNASIHDVGTTSNNQALYWNARDVIMRNTEVYNVSGPCLSIFVSNGGWPTNATVENSQIHHCGLVGGGAGILLTSAISAQIRNNLIYSNPQSGIECSTNHCQNAGIYNNTLHATANGISITNTGTTGASVRNNIVFNPGNISICAGCGSTANNLVVNPSFTNAAAFDFTLQSGSAAINAGVNLTACGITTDFAGVVRPTGSGSCAVPTGAAWEVGAYEFGGTPIDTTPPAAPIGVIISQLDVWRA